MKATLDRKNEYQLILQKQDSILREFAQMKAKLSILGSLRRFEELAEKGRKFARKKRITLTRVLQDD